MFVAIYDLFEKRAWLARTLFVATLAVFAGLAARVKFGEDISSMLPDNKDLRAMNNIISHTQAGEKLIFLVSFKDTGFIDRDSLIAQTTSFSEGLQSRCGKWIDIINLQAGSGVEEQLADIFTHHLPLFLTEQDYRALDTLTKPEHIRATLAANKKVLLSPASVVYKSMVAADPIGLSGSVWMKLGALQYDPAYELYDGYIFSGGGKQLTFFLKPKYAAANTGANSRFFAALNEYTDSFSKAHTNMHVVYFGGPAVAAGNATQMRADTIVTLSVTIVLLLALTFYYFRRKRTPLLLLLPVIYGATLGLAVMYLVQGGISIIALGAGAIVMGIAIDYSIHFLSHERHAGNMRDTIRELQSPLTIGSFTTIAAFLSLRFVHLPLLRDLGLFAAVSLIGAALCTLIFLPHFPLSGKRHEAAKPSIFDRMARFELAKSKPLLWVIVLLTPVMAWFSFRVQFDDDLMHLNYLSPAMKSAQEEVSKASAYALSSVFVIASGKTEEDALQKLEGITPLIDSLRSKGRIRAASNPAMLVSSHTAQLERGARWNAYWTAEKRKQVIAAINAAAKAEGFAPAAFTDFEQSLIQQPEPLDTSATAALKTLFPGGFARDDSNTHHAIAALKVSPENRASVLRMLKEKKTLTVTDRQEGATQLVRLLNYDFQSIALYSSLIVFFALLIAYGRIELALMSFLPMAISWVWILGLMAILGIKFNIVNIIISTLIFGLGDDYSIFTLDGLIERYKYRRDHTTGVRAAVYVSVATVLIGLGALLLAKHPALKSIAAISITGMLCVLIVSQTLQPALFNALIQKRADKRQLPFTAWSLAKGTFAFLYFLSGSLIVTICGIVLTTLRPFGKERSKLMLHRLIRRANWSLLYIMGNVEKHVYNRRLADFSKPAVYIANHTSFLDILLATSLHPKVVLLTNKWVYRSPVFGAVVRMAEYYPVADGATASLEPLRDLVRRGYSIFVFPEGTRSATDKVQRFHKGAFYIAQELGLDIVPVLLHGVHYTMTKGDWLLKDGALNLYFHNRIPPADASFGRTYSERAKGFGRWYRQALAAIKLEKETPAYFREQLLRCYTYKGPVLEWYCRIKTSLEGNYESFHRLLPRQGKIYDLGCGYGFAAYMLHWSAPGRSITGVDYDEDKIATAQALHLRDAGIQFEAADLRTYLLETADAILITDVLHYLLPDEQEALLERCVNALQPGGTLIIRDGVTELKERQKRTALTEVFSTQILGFNKTTNKLHFISRQKIAAFADAHGLSMEVLDEARYTSNLIFVLRKPAVL
jgi:1-acyl-sn-glycerol-3-phosphate acyltransferase